MYFLLPGIVMFLIFFAIRSFAHIAVFAKGLTPYTAWRFIFCLPVGMAATMILKILVLLQILLVKTKKEKGQQVLIYRR